MMKCLEIQFYIPDVSRIDTKNGQMYKDIHFPRPIMFGYIHVSFQGCSDIN